jgi:hypothetical protein
MTIITTASHQWATRPADERFTTLDDLLAKVSHRRQNALTRTVANQMIEAMPDEDDSKALAIRVDDRVTVPTHFAFGQLARLVGAPAGYLRTLPTPLIADCINWGTQMRPVEEVGTMSVQNGAPIPELACATGPNYGRVWNEDVVKAVMNRFGNGQDGQFTVPGEFGKKVPITKENTTLYAGDRDMFVFLADETNRIQVPNRRNGETGELARGFFVWNSEVGHTSLGIATFLFDYVCMNRIIWGAEEYAEVKIRHSSGAPLRFVEEIAPALEAYSRSQTRSITDGIEKARKATFNDPDKLTEFLRSRFTKGQAEAIKLSHFNAEGRPIESLWDVTVGATEYAKGIQNQDDRVALERVAGKVLTLAK